MQGRCEVIPIGGVLKVELPTQNNVICRFFSKVIKIDSLPIRGNVFNLI